MKLQVVTLILPVLILAGQDSVLAQCADDGVVSCTASSYQPQTFVVDDGGYRTVLSDKLAGFSKCADDGVVSCTTSSCQPPTLVVDDGGYRTVLSDKLTQFRKLADGRPVLLAMLDNEFTRTLGFYGGLERFISNDSDIFEGATGLDNTYALGVLQGRRHSTYLRSVFDFTYRRGEFTSAGISDGDIEVYSLMKNIYVDLVNPHSYLTTPYLGFGVGYAYVDAEGTSAGTPVAISSESTFAYQLLAGLSVTLYPRAHLFTEYRYFSTDNDVFNSALASEGVYSANNLFFGLRLGI